ncbi:hypothetical protein SEA_QBERT_136 [Mycobacterium phage QBert]|uniref:Uncharacterized protein n=1 Tax=Mycobacterium phage QBert TaxID=2502469 RepID=A0A411CC81_9CAUD|nr:hypothetical protein KHO63_gp171 [Mycobacterium phage QBert]QAY11477.1 hypothetical protein SEA_QBERT_136 [Mycobacterium phage QBert]
MKTHLPVVLVEADDRAQAEERLGRCLDDYNTRDDREGQITLFRKEGPR